MSKWSVVAFPFCLPACASETSLLIMLFMVRSYSLPMLLASVIPRSHDHFPFIPFPL